MTNCNATAVHRRMDAAQAKAMEQLFADGRIKANGRVVNGADRVWRPGLVRIEWEAADADIPAQLPCAKTPARVLQSCVPL